MTKAKMIDYIEKSEMVLDFSRNYFNHKLKKDVERFYKLAVEYNLRKEEEEKI